MTTHQPGSEIAGYRIESLIGRGGMAVVYRAEDTRLGRKVALKLLTPQLAGSEQFRQRFIRESRLAASLDHPNIVPIYEAGEAEGQLFIAMRYVLGHDLKAVLAEEGGRLPVDRTLSLFGQLGAALDAAHRAGLVHRDVKPGNVLVTATEHHRHGRRDHVYLTDFGLTKRSSELSGGLTGTGHFLGTVDYVSPEQIQGRPVGPGTDIYALGCVLYECLTGRLPFHRDDDAGLLWAHLVDTPPPVTSIRPELPAPVDAVVARAMAKEPADRYGSADDLVLALEQALGRLPAGSPTVGRPLAGSRTATVVSGPAPAGAPGPPPGGPDHPAPRPVSPGEDRTVTAAEGPSVLLPAPRTGEPAGGTPPPGRPDTAAVSGPSAGDLPPRDAPAAAGSGQWRNWWIALIAGLLALALAGAGVVAYRSLRPTPAASGPAAPASGTAPPAEATTGTPSPTLSPPRPVAVPGTVPWTDTGVSVTAGGRIVVQAGGQVSYIQDEPPVGPDGDLLHGHPGVCVLPGPDHHSALIGRIGASGTPFLVGSHFAGTADQSGELYLGINDIGLDNNAGAFAADVQVAEP